MFSAFSSEQYSRSFFFLQIVAEMG